LSEAIDSRRSSSELMPPVSTPETLTCSHSTGTLSALKISLTDSETSAPIPSPAHCSISYRDQGGYRGVPGIRVTVYLPPNLVGLKMSLLTVAIAVACQVLHIVAPSASNLLRETIDGPHRAGFAPRRSVCTRCVSRRFAQKRFPMACV
jgi:hypothetical protein